VETEEDKQHGGADLAPALSPELAAFTRKFVDVVCSGIVTASDPARSAELLRALVKTGLLKYHDMELAPEKFFLAHRLLCTIGLSGFGIRFTVQFNLFAGSIVGLGGPAQQRMLVDLQAQGALGCFLLTEMQAGVLSGLIVLTTAEWDPPTQQFVLHTPSDAAAKNWISQGFVAECGVVVADLRVGGKSHGPHAFFMRLRDTQTGELLPGIRTEDMGSKTVANDLDNARVWFDRVRLPHDALLNKFVDIEGDRYVQRGAERMRIEVIGQRLLTGRMAIAECALQQARVLYMRTERYACSKACVGLAGKRPLSSMPQLRSVLDEGYQALDDLLAFAAGVEQRLNHCLRRGAIPDADLVEAIAVCKIRCIAVATERVHRLRQEVGSYALMHGTGFELVDMLLCCKFAEGDSRILMQKLARDRLKRVRAGGLPGLVRDAVAHGPGEAVAAAALARRLAAAGKDLAKLSDAMDASWRELYALADRICDRHIATGARARFPEPCVDRFVPRTLEFDWGWKASLLRAGGQELAVAVAGASTAGGGAGGSSPSPSTRAGPAIAVAGGVE
jgi:acyl-CoA oxidase